MAAKEKRIVIKVLKDRDPMRSLRVDEERWATWNATARRLDISTSKFIRDAVDQRVNRYKCEK